MDGNLGSPAVTMVHSFLIILPPSGYKSRADSLLLALTVLKETQDISTLSPTTMKCTLCRMCCYINIMHIFILLTVMSSKM